MTILLALLRRYWLHLAVLATVAVLAAWAYDWAYDNGWNDNRQLWLERENKSLKQALKERDEARAQAKAAQKRADELDKPQREVAKSAKANPSGCDLAKPTGERLREQIRKTNDAIRAVP